MTTLTLTPQSAVVFDLDGVIVDSREAHFKAWQDIAAELGATVDRAFFLKTFGMRNVEIFALLKPDLRDAARINWLDGHKEELYRGYFAAHAVLLPGLAETLGVLSARGIPCGIGTSAPRANVDAVLDRFGIHRHFSRIVTSEDVSRGKPDPEVFVTCMDRLGASFQNTTIFEDSPGGVRAAVASGAYTIAVGGTFPEETLRLLGARDFIPDFRSLRII